MSNHLMASFTKKLAVRKLANIGFPQKHFQNHTGFYGISKEFYHFHHFYANHHQDSDFQILLYLI